MFALKHFRCAQEDEAVCWGKWDGIVSVADREPIYMPLVSLYFRLRKKMHISEHRLVQEAFLAGFEMRQQANR